MAKRAKQAFAFGIADGVNVVVGDDPELDVYADDHPYVLARPEMFRDVADVQRLIKAPVEQATAAPGETRHARKP